MKKFVSIRKYLQVLAKLEQLERDPGVTLFLEFVDSAPHPGGPDKRYDERRPTKILVTTQVEELLSRILLGYKVDLDKLVESVNKKKPGMLSKASTYMLAIKPKKVDWLCIFEHAGQLVDRSWRTTFWTKHHLGKKKHAAGNFGGSMVFGKAQEQGQSSEDVPVVEANEEGVPSEV